MKTVESEKKTKKCTKCGEVKEMDEFSNRKRNKDGKEFQCKKCLYEIHKKWIEKNIIKYRKQNNEKRKRKRRYYTEWKRKWRIRNKEKYLEYARKDTQKKVSKLTKSYIICVLKNRNDINSKDIPQEMIEIKRRVIIIKRLIKQKRQNKQTGGA